MWKVLFARVDEEIRPVFMWQLYLLKSWRVSYYVTDRGRHIKYGKFLPISEPCFVFSYDLQWSQEKLEKTKSIMVFLKVAWSCLSKAPKLFGPEKKFWKLRSAYSEKMIFEHILKTRKKTTAKLKRLSFEDTRRHMTPEIRGLFAFKQWMSCSLKHDTVPGVNGLCCFLCEEPPKRIALWDCTSTEFILIVQKRSIHVYINSFFIPLALWDTFC